MIKEFLTEVFSAHKYSYTESEVWDGDFYIFTAKLSDPVYGKIVECRVTEYLPAEVVIENMKYGVQLDVMKAVILYGRPEIEQRLFKRLERLN